jgi:hypothetical protein
MKYCQPHWDQLRRAIESRGMAHLIAKSGEQAAMRIEEELIGQATKHTFDPLMAAHNMVLERATRYFGLSLFVPNEDGSEKCPVCLLLTLPDEKDRDRAALELHYADDLASFMREICDRDGLTRPGDTPR